MLKRILARIDRLPVKKIVRFIFSHLTFKLVIITTLFIFSSSLLVIYNKDASAFYKEAIEALNDGHHSEALDILRRIESGFPNWKHMEDVYYQQGNILYFYEKDSTGAIDRWNRVLAINSHSAYNFAIHARMADIYQNTLGDMKRAIQQWKYLIDTYPDRPEIDQFRLNIANCFVRTDQFETAVIEMKNLLGDVRDEHMRQQVAVKIAMIYNLQKNYPPAQAILENLLANPHCTQCKEMAMVVLVDVLEAQEQYQKTLDLLQQIPDHVMSHSEKRTRIANIQKRRTPSTRYTPPPSSPANEAIRQEENAEKPTH